MGVGVSVHWLPDYLFKSLYSLTRKRSGKLCILSRESDGFLAQRVGNAESVPILWRGHVQPRSPFINTLRMRQHGHHFPDDIFKCIFVNENVWISIKFSLNIDPDGPIDNIPALVQILAWRRLGDKPLSEPMMVLLLTHICVTRPHRSTLIPTWTSNHMPSKV